MTADVRYPPVVLVNGPPGAGKSTLAAPLASELGVPLFGKDLVKETLADQLGVDSSDGLPRRAWNAALGAASAEALWTLLGHAYSGAVVESNFSAAPGLTAEGLRRAGVTHPVELWCAVGLDVARQRYQQRQATRHPIHRGTEDGPGHDAWWEEQNQPLGLGPVLRVDCSAEVDVPALARWCREPARGSDSVQCH